MEKKENKTWAIVATVAAILLCGCPGLSMCVGGAIMATGQIPYETSYYYTEYIPSWVGFATLCVSILFIAIAVVVPILMLRKKKEQKAEEILPPEEPLPPAS
jgi:Ni/Fe-hydrogenase subunit HybB-like protein